MTAASFARHSSAALLLLACISGGAPPSGARVLAVDVERRTPLLEGAGFGERGSYELLEGRVHFGFDPLDEANARVADLSLAPRGDDGLVHASADLLVLQAVDPAQRRGTAIVDVPNRGRRLALSGLNRAQLDFGADATADPADPAAWGDGFAMELGLTLVWVGWQADAPDFPGSMRLEVPAAVQADGSPVRGLARADHVVEEAVDSLPLAALGHRPHRAADVGSPHNVLTRRMSREGERELVAREKWRFTKDGTRIEMDGGFEAGIWELVYVAEAPPLVGLGFAAIRDIAAYAKHDAKALFPAERTIAMGSSQSGRFLRHFLYEGFNRDEAGQRAYEGVLIHIAGAGKGGFNHRFSQPGRVGNPFQNFFYPGDDLPFASRPVDAGGRREGLLDRAARTKTMPKLFQVNTGYEYWGRAASLVHMTPDGNADVEPLSSERLYHIASAPHYPMPFPPAAGSEVEPGIHRGSAIDMSHATRALFLHMLRWVEEGREPPASRVPRIDAGTLVEARTLAYPVPWLRVPRSPHVAYRLDFGPRFADGIVDLQPPRRGPAWAMRVPAIDALGNEKTGIRLPEVAVPIGTYTPWAVRSGHAFAQDEMAGYVGSFVPLARSLEEKTRRGDRRPSLHELYPTRAAYEARLAAALDELVREGWMLERDRALARTSALQRWNWIAR